MHLLSQPCLSHNSLIIFPLQSYSCFWDHGFKACPSVGFTSLAKAVLVVDKAGFPCDVQGFNSGTSVKMACGVLGGADFLNKLRLMGHFNQNTKEPYELSLANFSC